MSTATNSAIARSYLEEVFNGGQHDRLEEFLAEDIELHGSGVAPGLNAISEWLDMASAAFPDKETVIEDVVAEGDRVVVRSTLYGTHQGAFNGIPATGREVAVSSITIFRMDNGKIAEGWMVGDNLGMMQQLGLMPSA